MSLPPIPPPDQIIQSIRDSCKDARVAAGIPVDNESIKRLLASSVFQDTFASLKESHGLSTTLLFADATRELDWLGVLALLNCGSGYRVPLHAATGRGAYINIQALCMSLYISGESSLTAKEMANIKRQNVAELLGVTAHLQVEKETGIPGLTLVEQATGGPIFEIVDIITNLLNKTGEKLQELGRPSLGAFIKDALEEAKNEGDLTKSSPSASVVLHKLVKNFPGFQDMAYLNGKPVYLFKKALFLLHGIALRARGSTSHLAGLPVPDTSGLPVFCDNVIPSMMIHLGVLNLSQYRASSTLQGLFRPESDDTVGALLSMSTHPITSKEKPPVEEGPVLTEDEALLLRAAAIDQCEEIVQYARGLELDNDQADLEHITAVELDGWLWGIAKAVPEYRALPRYVLRRTPFF